MSAASVATVADPHARAFGAALADARIRAGLSQSRLADLCGYDHSYMSRLEMGKRLPSRETVEVIAHHLDLDNPATCRLLRAAGYWPGNWLGAAAIAIQEVLDNVHGSELHTAALTAALVAITAEVP